MRASPSQEDATHTSHKMIANSSTVSLPLLSWASTHHRGGLFMCRRMSLEDAESFTSDQVTSAIKSCRNRGAYGPDSLSIINLKNLGPLATEPLTTLHRFPSSARTHRKTPPTDQSRCYAHQPRSSMRSSYHLSTNFSHLLKINTTSDCICPPPAHNRHRDRFQTAETTSPYSVCGHRQQPLIQCLMTY